MPTLLALFLISPLLLATTVEKISTFEYKDHNYQDGVTWDETQNNLVLMSRIDIKKKEGALTRFDRDGKLIFEKAYPAHEYPGLIGSFSVMKQGTIATAANSGVFHFTSDGTPIWKWQYPPYMNSARLDILAGKTKFLSFISHSFNSSEPETPKPSVTLLKCSESRDECFYNEVMGYFVRGLQDSDHYVAMTGDNWSQFNFWEGQKFNGSFHLPKPWGSYNCFANAYKKHFFSVNAHTLFVFNEKGKLLGKKQIAGRGELITDYGRGLDGTIAFLVGKKSVHYVDIDTLNTRLVIDAPKDYSFRNYSFDNQFSDGNFGLFVEPDWEADLEYGTLLSRSFAVYDSKAVLKTITPYNFDEGEKRRDDEETTLTVRRIPREIKEEAGVRGCVLHGKVCVTRTRLQGHVVGIDSQGKILIKEPIGDEFTSFRGDVFAMGPANENGTGRFVVFFHDIDNGHPYRGTIWEVK